MKKKQKSPQSLSFNIKTEETTQPIKTLKELGFKEEEVKKYSDGKLVEHYAIFRKVTEIESSQRGVIITTKTKEIIFYDTGIYTIQRFIGSTLTSVDINKELHDAISLEARKWL